MPEQTEIEFPINGVTTKALQNGAIEIEEELKKGDKQYDRNFAPDEVIKAVGEFHRRLIYEHDSVESVKLVYETSEE